MRVVANSVNFQVLGMILTGDKFVQPYFAYEFFRRLSVFDVTGEYVVVLINHSVPPFGLVCLVLPQKVVVSAQVKVVSGGIDDCW